MERSGLSPLTLDDSLGTLYGVFDLLKTETACGVLTVRVGTELELVELTVFRNDAAAIIVLLLMSRICFSIAVLSRTTIVLLGSLFRRTGRDNFTGYSEPRGSDPLRRNGGELAVRGLCASRGCAAPTRANHLPAPNVSALGHLP
jgi:hypothetical protein